MLSRIVPALLVVAVFFGANTPCAFAEAAQATSEGHPPLTVAEANVSPELAAAHAGYVEWIRNELVSAGVKLHSGLATRRILRTSSPDARPDTRKLVTLAKQLGSERALLIDLRLVDGQARAVFRVYSTHDGALKAARRAAARPGQLAVATTNELRSLLPELVAEASAVATLETPSTTPLADFGAMSRALAHFDAGNATRASEELLELRSSPAAKLRKRIEGALEHPRAPLHEKASIVALRGNPEAAWQMFGEAAQRELAAAEPRPEVMVAAGKIQLARGKPAEALRYYDRAQRAEPKLPMALIGLARALQSGGDVDAAREAYQTAQQADPTAVEPAAALATLARSADERARHLIDAGDRAARRLEADGAQLYYEKAAQIDPGIEAQARGHSGDLHALMGEHEQAIAAYARSVELDGPSATRLRTLGRENTAVGNVEGAYRYYGQALELDDSDYVTLVEYGVLLRESKRNDEAMEYLEAAAELAPDDATTQRELARTLVLRGERARALELYTATSEPDELSTDDLRTMAAILDETGDAQAARLALERAIEVDPVDASLRAELADAYEASGDESAAAKQRAVSLSLQAVEYETLSPDEVSEVEQARVDASRPAAERFAALAKSFGPPLDRVVMLGVAEKRDWVGELRHWLWPKSPGLDRLAMEIETAIAQVHGLGAIMSVESHTEARMAQLLDFDSPHSLNAVSIGDVNFALASDAVFVGEITRRRRGSEDVYKCGGNDFYDLELRMLAGADEIDATVLSMRACLPNGVAEYAELNQRAFAIYGLGFALLIFPILRGWGRVVVHVKLPPRTKAMFSISLKKTPQKLKVMNTPSKGSARTKIEKSLRSLNRYERPLDQKVPTVFTMIPARRRAYHLTVRGPLLHSVSEEIVGNFLESKPVEVTRGRTTEIEFDLAPNEAAIQVGVMENGDRLQQAVVTIAGRRDLTRYCKDGAAFLYLSEGEHTLVVSDRNRVAERSVVVFNYDPQTIEVDLGRAQEVYFEGCPPAAMHYIDGDYAAAAGSLEAAGQEGVAHEIRARWLTSSGRVEEATAELEAAGQHEEAARLRATHSEGEESASLFEQAGDFASAARLYREAGDPANAARAYEAAYDYDNALECYQSLEDTEKMIELLEKTSDYLEAGRVAFEAGQLDRAIYDLQQCDRRHLNYSAVCRLLAAVLFERGELDVAIAKVRESLEIGGIDSCPIELHQRYAMALEEVEGPQAALAVWEEVRQRDLTLHAATTRIEELRKEISQLGSTATELGSVSGAQTAATVPAAAGAAPAASRYEILEELGRGGMGVVYKARDTHLGRIVALKKLTENMKDHPAAVQFFEREARSAAVLNHPNIVTVYDAGQEAGSYFISMEFMQGTPLDEILKQHGPIQPKVVARLASQISAGLDYAHRNKIIHRDIKTANLFFTQDKILKIMDFGLAKMVEEVRRAATVIGGTPYYMAPEQATGENVDHRADLYAFGVTLFQLLTGSVPFSQGDVSYHHRHTPAPDVRELAADVPAPMAELITKLMEKDPAARIQSAGEVGRVFQAWLEREAAKG